MTIPDPHSPELLTQARNAFRLTLIMIVVTSVNVLLYLGLAFWAGAWQLFGLAGTAAVYLIAGIAGFRLIRSGQPVLGSQLVIGGLPLAALVFTLFVHGFGSLLGLGSSLIASAIASQTLPSRWVSRTVVLGILLGLANVILDELLPPYRATSLTLEGYVPLALGVVLLVYGLLLARQHTHYSLSTKLILAFLIVALTPLGVLGYFNRQGTQAALTHQANQALLGAAYQSASSVDAFIKTNLDTLRTQAQLKDLSDYVALPPDHRPGNELEMRSAAILSSLGRRDPLNIASYALLDVEGRNVLDTSTSNIGADEAGRDYFKTPFRTGLPYASPVEFSAASAPALYFSSPVRTSTGDIIGVLRARYNAAILQQLILQGTRFAGQGSFAILLDEYHVRLAHTTAPELIWKSVVPLEPARVSQLQGAHRLPFQPLETLSTDLPAFEQGLTQSETQPYFTAPFAALQNRPGVAAVANLRTQPWQVVFVAPQATVLGAVEAQARGTVLIALLMAFLVAVAALFMARQLSGPLTRLTRAAEQVGGGDLMVQAKIESADEIGVLANTFNTMTIRLRQTQKTLQASELRYRTIFETVAIALWEEDFAGVKEFIAELQRQGVQDLRQYLAAHPEQVAEAAARVRILDVNPEALRLHAAASKAELLASLPRTFVPESYETFRQELVALAEGRQRFESEAVAQTLQGERRDILLTITFPTPGSASDQVLVGMLDITERKQAEDALQARQRFLTLLNDITRTALETPDFTAMLQTLADRSGELFHANAANITLWDAAAERIIPIASSDQGVREIFLALRPEPGEPTITATVLRTGHALAVEDVYNSPYVSARIAARFPFHSILGLPLIAGNQKLGAVLIAFERPHAFTPDDIARGEQAARLIALAVAKARLLNELEQRVAERTLELAAANRELEAFSYSVSHDLRAPLRAIDGFSRILLEDYAPNLAPGAQRYLHRVREGTRQMSQLIQDLLSLSHMSRQSLKKRPVAMTELVRQVLEDLHSEYEHRQVDIRLGELPPCQADPILLKQIWINLLSNALKYTRGRPVAQIEINSQVQAGERAYFIRDNGVGFDMRYVGKLFGVFQRLHSTGEFEGTGVGLAIVQRILQRHGGRIWAEAEVDKGATFYFTL